MERGVVYTLIYEKGFSRDLRAVRSDFKLLVKKKLEWLAENARTVGHQALRDPRFHNLFRLRVGDYRVFYKIDHQLQSIQVFSVKHRSDAYSK